MRVIVPAGIGDWSWIWSKLYSVRNEITSVRIVDGAPRRTREYVQACGIHDADYDLEITGGQYQFILATESALGYAWTSRPTWAEIQFHDPLLIEANQHLEAGYKLADWLPDLPCFYHYPLYVSDEDKQKAHQITVRTITGDRYSSGHRMKDGPVVGISCASYKGSEAWSTWKREEWIDFLKRVMVLGWRPIMVGGSWDDLTYSVACELDLPSTVGKTSVSQMIEQMGLLDAYIGFSSGMNVIRTVLNKPAFALWPSNDRVDQQQLSTSWVPPEMLESERYVGVTWRPVKDVWPVAKRFLNRCQQELAATESPTLSTYLREGYNGSGARDER
jgi:hypothetical protein